MKGEVWGVRDPVLDPLRSVSPKGEFGKHDFLDLRVIKFIVDPIKVLQNCFQGAESYCRFNETIAGFFRALSAIADPINVLQNCFQGLDRYCRSNDAIVELFSEC